MVECWVSVAIARPLLGLFDYECAQMVAVGVRVLVPFGRQQVVGVVMSVHKTRPLVDFALKSVAQVLDDKPLVDAQMLALWGFAARYYFHPIGEVMQAALPKVLREGGENVQALARFYAVSESGLAHLAEGGLGRKQAAVLRFLQAQGMCEEGVLRSRFALSARWLADLLARGWLVMEQRFLPQAGAVLPTLELNEAQTVAVSGVSALKGFEVAVVEGVTGSGKSEVYLRCIEYWCALGGQVVVLVPEIGLVQAMLARLRGRLQGAVVAHHSGLSDRERLDSWQAMANGSAQVLVGTRSAVWVQCKNLQAIVIDEEHDPAYKQQDGFRYHARDVAIMRAKIMDVPIVLGSATPSLECFHQVQAGRWRRFYLPERVNALALPEVVLEDMRQALVQDGLSVGLIQAIRRALGADEQVMLFLNRRGYAPMLRCENCGWQALCAQCETSMVAHVNVRELVCHHCGASERLPVRCPSCGQGELLMLGMGTQKLEQVLKAQFPQARVLRIDSDAFSTSKQFEQALEQVHRREVDIILGTQWLSKGHHFPHLNLVAIVDADQAFYSLDFRSEERLAQMLVQVSGRAGRERRGQVWVQTKQPEHPVFNSLVEAYAVQAKRLYAQRIESGLPPVSAQVLLFARHKELARVMQVLRMTKEGALSEGIGENWLWLGPAPAVIARKGGIYSAQLLLQAPSKATLQRDLPRVYAWFEAQAKALNVRYGLDVDPLWLE